MKNLISRGLRKVSKIVSRNPTIDINFKYFTLRVDASDKGGIIYKNRNSFEESQNLFYENLALTLKPNLIIDVGANYGFTGLIFGHKFPNAELILVEPSPKLCEYINFNLENNKIHKYQLLSAFCGEKDSKSSQFSLNPSSSQDNRVYGKKGWKKIKSRSITLSKLLENRQLESSIFIKIDTQGFETRVFRGAYNFLDNHERWLIKTEFAPDWLKSQGDDAKTLLNELVQKFYVVEVPARTRFGRDRLCDLFKSPLELSEVEGFIDYVENLNKNQLGWVDLYIAPKSKSWLYEDKHYQ